MKRSITLLFVLLNLGACSSGSTTPVTPAGDEPKPDVKASTGTPTGETPTASTPSAVPSAEPSATPAATSSGTKTTMSVTPGSIPTSKPDAELGLEAAPPVSTTQKALLHSQLAGTDTVFITVVDAGATCATNLKNATKGE